MFGDEDSLEALGSQGVEEVLRDKYTTKTVSDGQSDNIVRASQQVRLICGKKLPDVVTIAYESYTVPLGPVPPLECLACCKFGHVAASYPSPETRGCRKCSGVGREK